MPNWVVGNIRIRGTKENITGFLEEELECICRDGEGNLTIMNVKASWDPDTLRILTESGSKRSYIQVKGTDRNYISYFVEQNEVTADWIFQNHENEEYVVLFDGFQAAWNVDPQPYIAIAKKHDVDIRILGWESGAMLDITLEFMRDGTRQNHSISGHSIPELRPTWAWLTTHPNWGG